MSEGLKARATQLAKELMVAHNSHSDEGPTAFSEAAAQLLVQQTEIKRLTAALAEREAKLAKFAGLPMKYKRMEFNAALQKENDELHAKLAALEKQEPVDAVAVEDMDAGTDRRYGRVLIATENCIKQLYAAAGAAPVPEGWRSAVSLAYGHLWHVNNDPMAPVPLRSDGEAAYAARKLLRDLLTTEERGDAINAVQKLLAAAPKEPTP